MLKKQRYSQLSLPHVDKTENWQKTEENKSFSCRRQNAQQHLYKHTYCARAECLR